MEPRPAVERIWLANLFGGNLCSPYYPPVGNTARRVHHGGCIHVHGSPVRAGQVKPVQVQHLLQGKNSRSTFMPLRRVVVPTPPFFRWGKAAVGEGVRPIELARGIELAQKSPLDFAPHVLLFPIP